MKTIQPFIDLGFYTVPLQGKLKRLEDGSKSTPVFPKGWRQYYQEHFNENAAELGGAITGAISGIVAIDCDNDNTTKLFTSLDPDYSFSFISKGKGKQGVTLIYKYTDQLQTSFKINNGDLALDFYSDNGFVYLPSDANETKESWPYESMDELPKLREVPAATLALLKQLLISTQKPYEEAEKQPQLAISANYLAPQISQFISKKTFIPGLFRIITPKDFRDLDQYTKYGYLHPENVPEGRGSEYLSKISAILGRDPSIDQELYTSAMYLINDLWPEPMQRQRLDDTIMKPMLNGNASVDGERIWQHDPHWHTHGLVVSSKRGDSLEVFFDDKRAEYHIVDLLNAHSKVFYRDQELASYLETVSLECPPRKELKPSIPLVHATSNPALPFGFHQEDEYTRYFNRFHRSRYLEIIANPHIHEKDYQYPKTTINYLRTLVPDNFMRNYLLRFIKRKLLTFEYTPVVLYFLGKPGSGKDTFISILAAIMGEDNVAKPTVKEFLEVYNGWMVDKYFAQLDEYGDQLTKVADKAEALGKLKAYSGKPNVQIRQMRSDGFQYNHNITFVMTANRNPLMMDEDDRRVALFETPNGLATEQWVNDAGGISTVIESIQREIADFCYYLATQVDVRSKDEYTTPPASAAKAKLVAEMLPAAARLAYYFKNGMIEDLEELIRDTNMNGITDGWNEGKVDEDLLYELYSYMTDGQGSKRGMSKIMCDSGFAKRGTTKKSTKTYYFEVPQIRGFQTMPFESAEHKVNGV